ncbi:MAG: leucine-rich repeat protein [Flavobacteriales bacterium]|jgi:hypothetical protein|nr:leucine-rich repeat protein [Flavobacteriales bacterium]
MKTITVIKNQNLWDIALQEYGDISAIFYILNANSLNVDSEIAPGQKLNIPNIKAIDEQVVNYFNEIGYKTATGSFIFTPVVIPPPPPTGGDGVAKNSDNSYSEVVPTGTILNLPDSIITINNHLLINLPATNDLNIEVVDDNDTPIGELTNGKVLVSEKWKRNNEWLALTDPVNEDKFVGLLAVFPDGRNELTMRFSVTGGYTVDWGDGNIVNYNSNTNAVHTYDYNLINSATLTSDGYKQVIVTVTPTITTNNFTSLFSYNYNTGVIANWLDIVFIAPNVAHVYAGGNNGKMFLLERFRILGTTPSANLNSLFNYNPNIRVVELDWTKPTVLNNMFSYSGINKLGDLNITNSNTLPYINAARNIEKVGNLTYTGPTLYVFSDSSIRELGNITAVNASNANSFSQNNFSLCKLGLVNIPACTTATRMFMNNYALESIEVISTALSNAQYMFLGCRAIKSIVFSDLGNLTVTSQMFDNCYSLSELRVPNISVSFSVANCNLDRTALIQIFNDLATVSATITITGNIGVSNLTASDLLIATNKGWTVTQ